jgi:hypothetical protein
MNKNSVRLFFALAGLSAISACTSIVPVKDVAADPMGYLASKFSGQSISQSLAKKLPAENAPMAFKRLNMTLESTVEHSDGKTVTSQKKSTYINLGNGLVQILHEYSNNNIPYTQYYELSYKGIMDVRSQSVLLSRANTNFLIEMKDASRFDKFTDKPDREYVYDYLYGTDMQLANFSSAKRTCKVAKTFAASTLNAKLTGEASDLNCETYSNNVVQSRVKLVYLKDLDMAILMEVANSADKFTNKITDVNVVR